MKDLPELNLEDTLDKRTMNVVSIFFESVQQVYKDEMDPSHLVKGLSHIMISVAINNNIPLEFITETLVDLHELYKKD